MTVLIYSTRDDIHASAVQWGLRQLGTDSVFWPSGEFPSHQKISINVSGAHSKCAVSADGCVIDFSSLSAFWYRRGAPPRLNTVTDERDKNYVAQQSKQHIEALLSVACPQALWVNSPHVVAYEVNKPYQLQAALKVGLEIPDTLCSNDPDEVRKFCNKHGDMLAFKSYKMGTWNEGGHTGSVFVGYTSIVNINEICDDTVISTSPGIFQQIISKRCEIRTTFIGNSAFSVSISPQSRHSEDIDWRASPLEKLSIEQCSLPRVVEERLRRLKDRMGMVICTFDLILNSDGKYIFLEVNQMGQFLWKEEIVPELPLLDAMCRLLKSGNPRFQWARTRDTIKYKDFLES